MNWLLWVVAGTLGLLSFFEPCTIATHTLFAAHVYRGASRQRWQGLTQLVLARAALLSGLFVAAAWIGWAEWSPAAAMFMLTMMGMVYLISRKIYLPVPHLEFFRLMPASARLPQSLKLGLTLPACTLPLVWVAGIGCALIQQPLAAALAGLVFALMFTLPTLWDSLRGFTAGHRTFLGQVARASPYLTALLLWSGAGLIWQLEY